MSRPLGRIQKEVLRCLNEHGSWHDNCGWLWDTDSNTKRILDSLVRRKLVSMRQMWKGSRKHGSRWGNPTYFINDKGREAIKP